VGLPPLLIAGMGRSETSSRTLSNNGTLSPRSAHEETPPPSIIGSRSLATGAGSTAPWQVQDVASQLMSMMQAQQNLMQMLARTPTTSVSGTSTPDTPVVGQQQVLSLAMQQLLAQQQQFEASSATSCSTGSTSPRR